LTITSIFLYINNVTKLFLKKERRSFVMDMMRRDYLKVSGTSVVMFHNEEKINGFVVRPGFFGILDNEGKFAGFGSGWYSNGDFYVYRPNGDGKWEGRWESELPGLKDMLEDFQAYLEVSKAYNHALETNKMSDLYVVDDTIEVVYTEEEEDEGYEYERTLILKPTIFPGIFHVWEEIQILEWDPRFGWGTVHEERYDYGFRVITKQDFTRLAETRNPDVLKKIPV
jgi:hypothetical protein